MSDYELCVNCGQGVNVNGSGWLREIMGWEETRRQGGANKIVGRVVTGRVMHKSCQNVDAAQEALWR